MNKGPTMKLAAKLMLVFLLAVMLMTSVASYLTVQRAYERFERREREVAVQFAREIDDQLVAAWRQRGLEGLSDVVAPFTAPGSPWKVHYFWLRRGTPVTGASSVITREPDGTRLLHVYCPIVVGDGLQVTLEFIRSLESLEEETRDTIRIALASIGGMAAIAFGMVYVAGLRWIAAPLERLIEKTRRAGAGDFSGPVVVSGRDELAELATALNQMCDQLVQQQERIEAEVAKRLTAMEQLRHADRLKTVGRLAAGIAHELGTPLNVISGRAALIASGKLPAEELQSSADAIKHEADRITNIIRQLLDFARQRTAHRATLDVRGIAERTVELLKPLAVKRRVRVEVAAGPAPCVAHVDAGQIQQVLTNILVNAIQSMPQGGIASVRLDGCTRPSGSDASSLRPYLSVTVADQGEGIPPDVREHIFEPFFTTKDVGEGTGLGLSIAYGIVQDHNGWIDVESEPGGGSRFTIFLPQEPELCAAES